MEVEASSKNGSGALTLSNANTYTGATTLTEGNLTLNGSGTLGDGSSLTMSADTALTIAEDAGSKSIGALSSSASSSSLALNNNTLTVNQASDATFAGVISGSGGLSKSGSGTLTLSNANTYAGATTLSDGNLVLSGTGTLGNGSSLAMSADTALTIAEDAGAKSIGDLSSSASSSTIALNNNTLTVNQASNATFAGVISGSGGFTKNGSGALTLSSANTYAGATTLSGGELILSGSGTLGNGSSLKMLADTTLTIGAGAGSRAMGSLSSSISSATIAINDNSLTLNQTTSGTFAGVFKGTGSLIKAGSGTLTLDNSHPIYSGTTQIQEGALRVSSEDNLGTGGLLFTGGTLETTSSMTTAKGVTLTGSGTFKPSEESQLTCSGTISGSGSLIKEGAGSLVLSGSNTYSGGTTLKEGTLSIESEGSLGTGALNFSGGSLAVAQSFEGTKTWNVGTASFVDVSSLKELNQSGEIVGSGRLTKKSLGTLLLSRANDSFSGGVTIAEGVLATNADGALGSGTLIFDGGSLEVQETIEHAGGVNLASAAEINVASSKTCTFSGVISDSGSLTKSGDGVLVLSQPNSYTGGTVLNQGVIHVRSNGALGTGPVELHGGVLCAPETVTVSSPFRFHEETIIDVGEGKTLVQESSILGEGPVKKTGEGTLVVKGASYSGSITLESGTIQHTGAMENLLGDIQLKESTILDFAPNQDTSYAGEIWGDGQVIKEGSSLATLSGVSDNFSGTTQVSEGKLSVNGTLSGVTRVIKGGVLKGVGTLSEVINEGVVSPGNSIGTLNISGNYTQSSSGILEVELNSFGQADLLLVAGDANLDGLVRALPEPGAYTGGTRFLILSAEGQVLGTFLGVESEAGYEWALVYVGSDVFLVLGNDVIIASSEEQIPSLSGNSQRVYEFLTQKSASFMQNGQKDLLAELLSISSNEGLSSALSQISPAQISALPLGSFYNALSFSNANRSSTRRSKIFCKDDQAMEQFWFEPIGFEYDQDNVDEQYGFNQKTYGGEIGRAVYFPNHAYINPSLGFSHTNLNWKDSHGSSFSNSLYLSSSAGYLGKHLLLHFLVQGSVDYIKTKRDIAFAEVDKCPRASFNSYQLFTELDLGVKLGAFPDEKSCNRRYLTYLEPSVTAAYSYSYRPTYTEVSGGDLNLKVFSKRSSFGQVTAQAK